MIKSVKCFGKATVANFSCGFDILGFSVDSLGDIVKLTQSDNFQGVRITSVIGTDKLSLDPLKNTAGFAVIKYLERFDIKNTGVELELKKNMPLGSGMGSSAASAAAALIGINRLFDNRASERELLEIGIACESLACGSPHADNIAPSLFGGIILIRDAAAGDFIRLPVPEGLYCMIVHPDVVVNTKDSRGILPSSIPLNTGVEQWANVASLVSSLYTNDFDLLKRSLEDHVVEPFRYRLIPYFNEMREIALERELFNLSISGSGPSVFSLSDSEEKLFAAGAEIKRFLLKHDIQSEYYISKLNQKGSEVIKCEV